MEISNYNKKMKALNEVTWMRCFLAFLIVFFHSFLCFDGRWKPFEGIIDIPIYRWLSRISFSYTLEAFVLISGYIFAFQHITLQREERLEGLVWNKLKRLILPSILFSAVYFLLFIDYYGPANMLYRIVNGCGHMWYLPMLFWCFLGGWFLEKIKINDSKKLFFLALLSINSIRHLPFSFDRTLHYLVFFWGGYVLYQHKDRLQSKLNGKRLLFGWIFFAVVFFLLRNMQADLNFTTSNSYLTRVAENLCQLLYSGVGALCFYCTALYYTQRHSLSHAVTELAACSFGIYLFQQFVLQILYYKTSLPITVGPYWLPWLGFIITAGTSFVLSFLLRKTKAGKFIIG